jgi:uncharacterized membrane protein YphA (DoxX/SURF4 family)
MRFFAVLCRLAVGVLFVFSGFVKAIDPLGSNYKFIDYFEAFGTTFMEPLAMPLGVLLAAAEMLIGLCLVVGLRTKLAAWALLLFMSFFTVLTLVLAIFNPVSDCGCFGDAIKLTNWQTFFKNIILFVPTLVIFAYRERYKPFTHPALEWLCVLLFLGGGLALSAWCYRHLPPLDFMPYHVGQHIPSAMSVPNGAPHDVYKTVLVYAKDGVEKEFSDTDFPWQDSTWTFVDSRSTLLQKGYEPPIHNFSITHSVEGDITDSVLSADYAFLVIAPKLEQSENDSWDEFKAIAASAKAKGHLFVGLTSSTQDNVQSVIKLYALNFDIGTADETTLKSMVRAHPGLMLLHRGVVVGKWSWRDLPSLNPDQLLADTLNAQREIGEANAVRGFVASGLVLLLLVVIAGQGTTKRRR